LHAPALSNEFLFPPAPIHDDQMPKLFAIWLPILTIDYHYIQVFRNKRKFSMKKCITPYKCHLFVCTNSRSGEQKSCGDEGTPDLKAAIKAEIKNRGWKGIVRVSASGCLGVCESGPNIMIYPQKTWFSDVSSDNLPEIIQTVEEIVENVER
jgi:(2Fe-2S) ferredoxin